MQSIRFGDESVHPRSLNWTDVWAGLRLFNQGWGTGTSWTALRRLTACWLTWLYLQEYNLWDGYNLWDEHNLWDEYNRWDEYNIWDEHNLWNEYNRWDEMRLTQQRGWIQQMGYIQQIRGIHLSALRLVQLLWIFELILLRGSLAL